MSFIAEIPYVGWILPFLLVLGVVVFVHEYGHYIVGRMTGIRPEVFSIGFGRELFHWVDKRGCRWRVAALPLGGYVKFAGDMNAASAGADTEALAAMSPQERAGAFHLAPVWARTLTVLAGPVANFLLSILVFAIAAMVAGREVNEPVIGSIRADAPAAIGFQAGDRVLSLNGSPIDSFSGLLTALEGVAGEEAVARVARGGTEQEIAVRYTRPALVDRVVPGGAGADAGLKRGDVVTAVNGTPTPNFDSLRSAVLASGGEPLVLSLIRKGSEISLTLTPQLVDMPNADGVMEKRAMIGVSNASFGGVEPKVESVSLTDAFGYGAERTFGIVTATLAYVRDMFAGRADTRQLGGPIQIAKVSGQAAEQGIGTLVTMIALISTSIGLINLFPIPVLDGGHLVFYAVEALKGSPVGERWQEYGNRVGLSLILLLMVFATYNDVLRLLGV